jgi:hypothetical protein
MSMIVPMAASVMALASSCNFFFPFNADQICETRIRALCHFAFSCCNASERAAFANAGAFRNEGECVNELLEEQGSCGNALQVQEAVNQGRFEYDGALAEKCEKQLIDAANSCDADAVLGDKLEEDEECAAFGPVQNFAYGKGLVKDGDACFAAFECADEGSVCDPQEADEGEILKTAVGSCRAPAKEGEDCSEDGSDGLCEPGTFCDFGGDVVCVAIELKQNGDSCFADGECESGFCNDVQNDVQPTCDDRLDDGEECIDSNDCDSFICDFDADANNFICLPPDDVVVEACNGLQGDDTEF